jgi:EAL and modified HD-GYP domain-containing signal transduction protein
MTLAFVAPPTHQASSTGTETIYLARQPILDASRELVAYEILFRSADTDAASVQDDVQATSTVIAHAFGDMGLDKVLGPLDGYLNLDAEFLESELIESLPPRRIVLELLERRLVESHTAERCAALRKRGFRIAVDSFVGNFDTLESLGEAIDVVKVDFHRLDPLLVPEIVRQLKPLKVTLVAEKVETAEQFEQAAALGFKLFQGYHFSRPQTLSTRRAQPAQMALMRILTLATQDADLPAIEGEFKRHPTLAINLLRLVNSAALSRGQPITSLRHALTLLGRRQLTVWLQLLLYTADRGNRSLSSPLLQLAAVRGKVMELAAKEMQGADREASDLAFMTGILSPMDALLQMPLEEIVGSLSLPDPVRDALLTRTGPLGPLLRLAIALERPDGTAVRAMLDALPTIDRTKLMHFQMHAMTWASQLGAAA